jgi:hypothetical protein
MRAAKRMLAEKPMRSRGHQKRRTNRASILQSQIRNCTLAWIFTAILIGTLAKPDSVSAAGGVSTAIHAAAHLPPVPADVLDSLNERPETQTKGRLQIGLGRTLPQPMVVNSRTVPASSWEVSSNWMACAPSGFYLRRRPGCAPAPGARDYPRRTLVCSCTIQPAEQTKQF